MAKLSVAIIAHNEAHRILQALESVKWADQVVVVDTESEDGTGDIARQWGAEVLRAPNNPNLNVNKNTAISACRNDWILVLDADEVIPEALRREIEDVIETAQNKGYLLPRQNFVWGSPLRYGGQYPDWQLRLFRKGWGIFPAQHIHERLKLEGKVGRLKSPMHHYPYPDLASMVHKGFRDALFEADYLRARGYQATFFNLCLFGFIQSGIRFFNRYVVKGGFLDGIPGLAMAFFDATNRILRWLRLWELERKAR